MGSGKGVLSLVGTKTDYKFKGVKLIFFRNDTECCPFTAMSAYLTGRPGTHRNAPLFVDSFRNKITQAWVISRLRIKLRAANFQAELFSGISLRKGGAQTLLRLKANDITIMGMGRWIASCFNRYLMFEESAIKNWQTLMANLTSPSLLPCFLPLPTLTYPLLPCFLPLPTLYYLASYPYLPG